MTPSPHALDPKWLQFMELLHRTGSVTRSAEQLGVSQPTVSIWLSQLRKAFDDPLFVRTPTGMQPTPRTQAMMPTVRSVLEGMQRLMAVDAPFDPAHIQREFRILMTDASHVIVLPRLFAHVRQVAPHVRLAAQALSPMAAHDLEAGEADLAIGLLPGLQSGFYQQALFAQDWICLANANHPRVQQTLDRQAYEREGHVGIVSGTGQKLLEATMISQGVERRVALMLPGFLGLTGILTTTDLLATVPRQIGETLAHAAHLQVLPCPLPIPSFVVKQHWHSRFHHDPANRWLRGLCADLFLDAGKVKGSEPVLG